MDALTSKPDLTALRGNDNRGRVYRAPDTVLRSVHPEYREQAIELFDLFARHDLEGMGFVPTTCRPDDEYLFEHTPYLTTFPHEWPSEMLRDAAIFTLDLFEKLDRFGLTLKDALPSNVLFERSEPRFIDFLSLIHTADLPSEAWLAEKQKPWERDLRTTILRDMLFRFFLMPLFAFATRRPVCARQMLRHQSCNQGWDAKPSDLLRGRAALSAAYHLTRYQAAILRPLPDAIRALRNLAQSLRLPATGAYSTYYEAKGEDFDLDAPDTWQAKQRSVAAFLNLHRPQTVLDIGANTGWFSRLAEKMGAKVIATDIDEASVNRLYLHSREAGCNITPLRIAFGELTEAVPDKHGETFFTAPVDRLQCDGVLMLGLIHHLCLGEGRSMDSVLATVAKLANKAAAIEFVGLDDPLVAGNPGYFPKIAQWSPENYNVSRLVEAAKRHFQEVAVSPSHPDTRVLVTMTN